MEGVLAEVDDAVAARIEGGEGVVHPFDPVDIAVERAEDIADDGQAMDVMARPARRDHQPAEMRGDVVHGEDVAGDGEAAEGEAAAEGGLGVMFVRPFDEAVVDVIAGEQRLHIGRGQHDAGPSGAIGRIIALEEMVAHKEMPGAPHDGEGRETDDAVATDLGVVGVDVQRNRGAVLCGEVEFVRLELAGIDHQALTARADGGDAPVARAVEDAIVDPERKPDLGQHQPACDAAAIEFDFAEFDPAEVFETAEINQVAVALEGEGARPRRPEQGLAEFKGACRDVDGADIDLASDARAADPRACGDVGDVGDGCQTVWLGDGIGGDGGDAGRRPGGIGNRLELAVAEDAALVETVHPG